jgi:hypothetical protein
MVPIKFLCSKGGLVVNRETPQGGKKKWFSGGALLGNIETHGNDIRHFPTALLSKVRISAIQMLGTGNKEYGHCSLHDTNNEEWSVERYLQ